MKTAGHVDGGFLEGARLPIVGRFMSFRADPGEKKSDMMT